MLNGLNSEWPWRSEIEFPSASLTALVKPTNPLDLNTLYVLLISRRGPPVAKLENLAAEMILISLIFYPRLTL